MIVTVHFSSEPVVGQVATQQIPSDSPRRASSPLLSLTLVLIVRNEEVGLRATLSRIPLGLFEDVLVVDGNSLDGTVPLLQAAGIRVHRQVRPGLGAAMVEARQMVKTDAFIFFHPDGNEDPGDLPRMADLLRQGRDFVVASRMIRGAWNEQDAQVFKWRKWANLGFVMLANLLFGNGRNSTSDVTNGFRGVTCAAFDKMSLTSFDMTMDYQMVIRALKLGIPITEFPTREGNRVAGQTNFSSLPTGIAEVKLLIREVRMGRRSIT